MELYKKYRQVKDKIAALEEVKRSLELEIFDLMDSDGIRQVSTAYGQFSIMGRKTYEYSTDIKSALIEISKRKKIEELDGTAMLKSDSRYLRIIIPKDIDE